MRYVEDQGNGRSRAPAGRPLWTPGPRVAMLLGLAVAAAGGAYAVGAGLQHDAAMAVMLAVAAAFHLGWAGWALMHPDRPLLSVGAAVVVGFALQAAVPALLGGHVHGPAGEEAEVTTATEAQTERLDGGAEAAGPPGGDDRSLAAGEPLAAGGYGSHAEHDDSVISLYDPRLTDEQRQTARQLIDDTKRAMVDYPDVDSVVAAGYQSIGDSITGFEHFIHPGYMADGVELDPARVESIVARVNPDGSKEVVSAMFLLEPGATMDDVPDVAGPLTVWHDHQDLCWEGIRVVGRIGADGSCFRGEFRATVPMLHVWLVPHPCGPFAGLEGHGGSCAHEH